MTAKLKIDESDFDKCADRIFKAVADADPESKDLARQCAMITTYVDCALKSVEKALDQRDERLRKMAERVRELERQLGINYESH